MKEVIEIENLRIEDMIYEVRGVEVMFASDLAVLYQCTNGTKDINKAVNRNIERFPDDFYFQLTKDECSRFQTGTLNMKRGENIKYLPYVFTEQGVAMLASVLHTKIAVDMSVKIMRSFVKMRNYINYNKSFLPYKFMLLEDKVDSNTERINELFDMFNPKVIAKDYLFFQGDFYDAYSLIMNILTYADKDIIIIDNYIGKGLLDILRKIDKKITIITLEIDEVLLNKYKKQYKNITFKISNIFHDRFIIIDRYRLFSCGASLKDLGKKCFGVNEIFSKESLKEILKVIDNI